MTARPIAAPRALPICNDPVSTPREALRRIVDGADIILVEGRAWLLVGAPRPLLDYLAEFEAAREDLEEDDPAEDDDPGEHDFRPFAFGGAR